MFRRLFRCCFPKNVEVHSDKNINSINSINPINPINTINPTTPIPINPIKQTKQTKHKKDLIPRKVRNEVWIKYHGQTELGICYCCGISITRYRAGWHCSHVIADSKGGQETVENLRTCCRHCNLSMGNQNLYTYMKEHDMKGPGARNIADYFRVHPEQLVDKRGKSIIKH